jgi:hypothetical protein
MNIRKIIESLKEIENGYKPVLKDAYEIADYIQETSPQDVDCGLIVDFFMGTKAILKEVPIDSISPDKDQDHHIKSNKKLKKYKSMTTNPPPIMVEDGIIRDGHHRFEVAKYQGKKTILIYDIVEI